MHQNLKWQLTEPISAGKWKSFYLSGWTCHHKGKGLVYGKHNTERVAVEMKVRFVAEIVDDNGKSVKAPVTVETDVPDVTEFTSPSEFYKVFDRFERPVIEARNQIASEIAKDYLDEAVFLKGGENKSKDRNRG